MDVYCTSCFGCVKFSGFPMTKTSANKRLFIYMSANDCIATVCRSGIYIARRSLTTQDVSNRKNTTNVWIVQVIMKNYYSIGIERSSMRLMRLIVARATHKAVLCATISRNAWQKMYYLPCIYRISTVYLPCIYRISTVVGNGKGHKNRLSEIIGQPVLYQVVYLRRIAKCTYQLITNPACTLIPACA